METSGGVTRSFLRLSFEWDKILPHELIYIMLSLPNHWLFSFFGVEIKLMEMFINQEVLQCSCSVIRTQDSD